MSKSMTIAHRPNTHEIPEKEWIPYLAEFTRENRGANARLEIVGADKEVGYQVETEDRPFDGVAADIKDRERTVWIAFGSTAEDHLTHGVHGAAAIRVLPSTEARGSVLEVEAADGTKTILELTLPESYALPPGERR
jgi:Family of unknown function (DUF5335)